MTTGYRRILGFLLLTAGTAQAQWQDLAAVRGTAEGFARDQVRTTPGTVEVIAAAPESRLRLPHCPRLVAFAPPAARWWGSTSVGIRCEAPSQWSLYVPVSIRVVDEVIVTTHALSAGHAITAGDVTLQSADITQLLPTGALSFTQVLGRTTKTSIAGGMMVREDQLRTTPIVMQGDAVQLAFAGNGFEVHSRGSALAAAGLGEPISVKADSGRVVKGVVRARGSVLVQ